MCVDAGKNDGYLAVDGLLLCMTQCHEKCKSDVTVISCPQLSSLQTSAFGVYRIQDHMTPWRRDGDTMTPPREEEALQMDRHDLRY